MEDLDQHHSGDPTGKGRGREKEFTIVVNGREKTVTDRTLSFDQLVHLAFEDPPTGEFICFTITYRRGHGDKPEGILKEGKSLKVKDGMIVNVIVTDKS